MQIKRRLKRVLFALAPLFILMVSTELAFRILGVADSPMNSPVLPGETAGLIRYDSELFWSLRPNLKVPFQGVTVVTNELGLRSGPVLPKQAGEFRILSLGESTTFGAGVEGDQTYSARLEGILNEVTGTNRFTVINAGVSAYTSFQSLVYLKERGFELSSDLVIFYHEYNDFLPTSIRDSRNNVIGMNLSDPERYRSRGRRLHRSLLQLSAVYRYVCYRVAMSKIREFQNDESKVRSNSVVLRVSDREESLRLPLRVGPEERVAVLVELIEECRKRGVRLVIIHPSYYLSKPHQCDLTDVCAQYEVPMLQAQTILHPARVPIDDMFLDRTHPTALGHERLAEAIAAFLIGEGLLSAD